MFGALFIWLRDLDTREIGAKVFGKHRHVLLKENEVDKMVRESVVLNIMFLHRLEDFS